jgi:hypothetical protein
MTIAMHPVAAPDAHAGASVNGGTMQAYWRICMKRDDEPKLWVTVLKLVVGLAILIGGVGLALNYAEKLQEEKPIPQPKSNWGIFSDSPIRR